MKQISNSNNVILPCVFFGISQLFIIQVQAQFQPQIICWNPTTNCFDPTTTQSLLFQQNRLTTCARNTPIQQLNCVDGSNSNSAGLCEKYSDKITSVKCSNSGTDESNNVIWKCESNLPDGLIFGSTIVSCEGCKSSTDELKITGSCGIFYELVNTVQTNNLNSNSNSNSGSDSNLFESYGIKFLEIILIVSFIVILCAITIECIDRCEMYAITHLETERIPLNSNIHNITEAQPVQPVQPVQHIDHVQHVYHVQPIPSAPPENQNSHYDSYHNSHYDSYPRTRQYQDSSNFVTGYIVGRELEEGNVGDAMLISSMSNGGNNYNTGMMMGMMSGNNYSHSGNNYSHHAKKSHTNSGSTSNHVKFAPTTTFAKTVTR